MEGQRLIQLRGECLWANGRGAGGRAFAAMCRALVVACVEKEINRVLIDATQCDREAVAALRDAFTVMSLAGIPDRFRVALVSDARLAHDLMRIQRDLTAINIAAKLFAHLDGAADWLADADKCAGGQTQPRLPGTNTAWTNPA